MELRWILDTDRSLVWLDADGTYMLCKGFNDANLLLTRASSKL